MKWSCLDKLTMVIFIQEIVLGMLSIFLSLILEGLMTYPVLFQIGKAVTIGICLFFHREKACGRWVTAIVFAVVMALDVLYFLFWFVILGALLSAGCSDPAPEHEHDCENFGGVFGLWMIGCMIVWLVHLSSSIILCCWGCEGNKVE